MENKTLVIVPMAPIFANVPSPNLMIFQKKHLNDIEIHIFFHFQVHNTII
jgi:hypothetical protein